MAQQLAYVIITPYTLSKSRTGGIIARLITRTGLDLVAARMFAPGPELVKGLVEGLVNRITKEMGAKPKVIATGGYAHVIAKETSVIEVVNRHLTLYGLQFIYDLNRR